MPSTEIATTTNTTLAEQMEFARMVTATPERGAQSILPEVYRNNPANVLIAVGLGSSMGLSQAESLYRIVVIKGKPTAAAELIASNVRKSGHRLRVRGDETTCTATIVRGDDKDYEFSVTRDIAWARGMGLASNDNYKKQPGTMLQWRAISAVARQACPEALYGVVYTSDEMFDMDGGQPSQQQRPQQRSSRGGVQSLRDHVAPASSAQAAAPSEEPPPVDADVVDAEVVDDGPALITAAQQKALHAGLGDAGLGDRVSALAFLSDLLDRDVDSTKSLTVQDASLAITELQVMTAGQDVAPSVGDAA